MAFLTTGGSQVNSANIVDGSILNADVNANAGILASKISGKPYETLADVTLGSAATSLSTGAFTAKTVLRVLIWCPSIVGADRLRLDFNADGGNNYNVTVVTGGGAASTDVGTNGIRLEGGTDTGRRFHVCDIYNITGIVKPVLANGWNENAQDIISAIWTNTANQITSMRIQAATNLGIGTRIIVMGHN